MIVSHEHRFIFIKTKKTAGTSVEIALSEYTRRPDDIISPILKPDEAIRRAMGFSGPQNYREPFSELSRRDKVAAFAGRFLNRPDWHPRRFWNHMPATEVRSYLPADVWNTYTKFTIERSPWDKVVSAFFWHYRKGEITPDTAKNLFRTFVLTGVSRDYSDYWRYADGTGLIVDRVIQYANLQDELQALAKDLGLKNGLDISRDRINAKSDKRWKLPARELLDDETIAVINRDYWREIEAFGYSQPVYG